MIDETRDKQLAALIAELSAVRAMVARLEEKVDECRYGAARLAPQQLEILSGLDGLEQRMARAEKGHEELLASLDHQSAEQPERSLATDVWTTMTWIADDTVPEELTVSVIIATRNRSEHLRRAIESVRTQQYPRWQLVVVDDGSEDETPALLATLEEDRFVAMRTEGVGVAAARNRGLEAATGKVIAYLDDDNRMHPAWLRSVAWAFTRWPDIDVIYGARIVDDWERTKGEGSGGMPSLIFQPYSWRDLERYNTADTNVIAHRAGLAEAHFDEDLAEWGDWDQLLRLTKNKPPLVLPALACFYTTSAPNRLSHQFPEEVAVVRRKHGLPPP